MPAQRVDAGGGNNAKGLPVGGFGEFQHRGVAGAAAEIQHGDVRANADVGAGRIVPAGRNRLSHQDNALLRYAGLHRSGGQAALQVFVPGLRVGQDHLGREPAAHKAGGLSDDEPQHRCDEVDRIEDAVAEHNGILAEAALGRRFEGRGIDARNLEGGVAREDFTVVGGHARRDGVRACAEPENKSAAGCLRDGGCRI